MSKFRLLQTFFTHLWPLLVVNNNPGTSKTENIVAMTRPRTVFFRKRCREHRIKWNVCRLPSHCVSYKACIHILLYNKLKVRMPAVSKIYMSLSLSVSKRIHVSYIPTRYHEPHVGKYWETWHTWMTCILSKQTSSALLPVGQHLGACALQVPIREGWLRCSPRLEPILDTIYLY